MSNDHRSQKRWGRVSAKPSEYLIKLRRGEIVANGAGLSVFLWPGDTCTILPTSIQRASFVADQVTAEKVGVSVAGVAVYRIADPLLAFRVLDFEKDMDEETLEPLGSILREMFIGAARRLVANMSIEDCLTRRKEAIAQELMAEILPVVSGRGRPDDRTKQGWGVVIDTIEIQDVRILSEHVFAQLQAPYRSNLELRARSAEMTRDQQILQQEVTARREALEAEQELARERATADEERARSRFALEALERAAEAEAADHQVAVKKLRGELETALKRQLREVDNTFSDERIRYELVSQGIPAAAQAFAKTLGQVHLTHLSSEGESKLPGLLSEGLMQLLAVARGSGIKKQAG